MSAISSTVQRIPRVVVEGYLEAGRLPITAAQRLFQQQGNALWPPALAYETFGAKVEARIGALLHDDVLAAKGLLRTEKVTQLRTASQLDAKADERREQADRVRDERQAKADQARAATQQRAEQREQQITRQATDLKKKAAAKAAKQEAIAREEQAARTAAAERRERAASAEALEIEAGALRLAKVAADAQEQVDEITADIDTVKKTRSRG